MPRTAAILGALTASTRSAKASLDVVFDDRLEFLADALALERDAPFAVDEHRRNRLLTGSRQTDADVGMAAFAGAIDHAAHHGDGQVLDAGVAALPLRHPLSHMRPHARRQVLEHRAGGTPAARTRGHHRHERAQPERLQDLLRDL